MSTSNKFNRTITWGDGSTEHVRIDEDGFFILDGVKKRLVGFEYWLDGDSDLGDTHFYHADQTALYNTTFAYLASVGVRLIHLNLFYTGLNRETDFDTILTAAYNNKLMVIAQQTFRWNCYGESPNYGTVSTIDFIVGKDSDENVSDALPKWVAKMKEHTNVVAYCWECEVDGPSASAESVRSYIRMGYKILRDASPQVPIVTKFLDDRWSDNKIRIQNNIIDYTDIFCIDCYEDAWEDAADGANFHDALHRMQPFGVTCGKPSQTWILEFNYSHTYPPQATGVTADMITNSLAHNVSVIMLAPALRYDIANNPFFDAAGDPIANTETLLANIDTWQASI